MIDLQLHTTDSDGTWTWLRVAEACVSAGLKAFAITDHDTIYRRDEILAWGKGRDLLAIPGLELSTRENGQPVHLLGYFFDGPLGPLEEKLVFLRKGRVVRNGLIIGKLQKLGYNVSEEEVKSLVGQGSFGRPHIAQLLVQKGIVHSLREAFGRFLSSRGAAYVPKEEVPLREGIDLLHGAGAVAVVAHPGLLKRTPGELETSFDEWRGWGLDGIEAIYPGYSNEQRIFFQRMASKFDFLMTGGSDFHGDNKPSIRIGVGSGDLHVPDHLITPLLDRRDQILKAV